MQKSSMALAILCGGRSRRFGSDKGLFTPSPEEPPLFIRAINRFTHLFSTIMVVVCDQEQADLYGMAVDRYKPAKRPDIIIDQDCLPGVDHAAIRGVVSALKITSSHHLMVMAVDQLGVAPIHLRVLGQKDRETPQAFVTGEDLFPLPSLWPKSAFAKLLALAKSGQLSLTGVLRQLQVKTHCGKAFANELTVNANKLHDLRSYMGQGLYDRQGRRLIYLRLSLTEACNMACQYCLPEGFEQWMRHKAFLQAEDIKVLIAAFRRLGFRKLRLTGGEPTLHAHCLDTVSWARKQGYESICLTTNGLRLGKLQNWVDAGLTQVNISLDSLNHDRFFRLTKSRGLTRVLNAIDEAIGLGLKVKINTVLMRSHNVQELPDLLDWANQRPLTLRFIELMPTSLNQGFDRHERVEASEVLPYLTSRGFEVVDKNPDRLIKGPETLYHSPLFLGKVGLINPLSDNFCASCNRLRVTSKGALRLCLFGQSSVPLPLTDVASCVAKVRQVIGSKEDRHFLENRNFGDVETFRHIGG